MTSDDILVGFSVVWLTQLFASVTPNGFNITPAASDGRHVGLLI